MSDDFSNKFNANIEDILQYIKKMREATNGNYDKISNKDLLFYMLSKFENFDNRITEIEKEQEKIRASVKVLLIIIPIVVSIISLIL